MFALDASFRPRPAAPVRLPVQRTRGCAGFSAALLRGAVQATDPVIAVDHFRMTQPTFGAHPQAGFSAVTHVLPGSETALIVRDPLGGQRLIEAGNVRWTMAGRGVMHKEVPADVGRTAHGLQMFVNLPAAQQQRAPAVLHLAAERMPRRYGRGWHAVQVFGGTAPLALPVLAALRREQVQAGADDSAELADGEQGFAWLINGQARLGSDASVNAVTDAVTDGDAWVLRPDETARAVHATTTLQEAVLSGRPLREPVVQHGPFVMNSEAEIVLAPQRFQADDMGRLASAHAMDSKLLPAPETPAA